MLRSFDDDGSVVNHNEVSHNKGKRHSVNEAVTKIEISRSLYNQQDLHDEMLYNKKSKSSRGCANFKVKSINSFLLKTFPFLSMFLTYKMEYLAGDVISGFAVCTLHLPGMGHALLANLPPVVGIYMAFWPALMYGLFASSRHNSLGTFSVLAIMTEKSVVKYATPAIPSILNQNSTETSITTTEYGYSPLEVACLLCFLVGVIQLLLHVLRLGVLAVLLSDSLVSGLTTGAAIHIFTAQAKDFVGVTLPPLGAYFKIINAYIEIFKKAEHFNYITLSIFVICCILLVFNNEWLKQRVAKKTNFPVPMELIVIIAAMFLSKLFNIEENWNVFLLGDIPNGLPTPTIPKFDLWKELLVDAFAIAMVSYSVSVSLALMFARKSNYEIDFNQELLALGSANMIGAFFSCFPLSAALGRSALQFQVGGKTQVASIVNVALIMCILLWITPIFELIPRVVLSSIIVIAIKGMLMQVFDFMGFWRKSKVDGLVFAVTFLTVVIVSIDIGLAVGMITSCAALLYNTVKPHVCLLGHIPTTDLYLDIKKFEKAIEIPFVKIFHYSGSITFATKASFKNQLCEKLKINILKELKKQKNETSEAAESVEKSEIARWNFNHLILDFSAMSYIDASSVAMLNSLIQDFIKLNVKVSIAGCSTKVFEALKQSSFEFIEILYPTIHDAINSQKCSEILR